MKYTVLIMLLLPNSFTLSAVYQWQTKQPIMSILIGNLIVQQTIRNNHNQLTVSAILASPLTSPYKIPLLVDGKNYQAYSTTM